MQTGRFGGQPERSVFSVWVLTGFACCTARKSRSTHAIFRKCSYTCCACSSSKNHIGQNVCSCYNWAKRLKKSWNAADFHWQSRLPARHDIVAPPASARPPSAISSPASGTWRAAHLHRPRHPKGRAGHHPRRGGQGDRKQSRRPVERTARSARS